MTYSNGLVYQGEFKDSKHHGFGILHDPNDGSSYTGQWEEDLEHGKGEMVWASGNEVYKGDFYEG